MNSQLRKLGTVICLFSFLIFSQQAKSQTANPFYSQTVYTDAITDGSYKASVADLTNYLSKATGRPFVSLPYPGTTSSIGIYALLNRPGLLPLDLDQKLKAGSIEDFIMVGNGNILLLVGNHPAGVCNAIYTYLDRIGVKWYFPREDWTVVPSLANITITAREYQKPSFNNRRFFGTGGIFPIKVLDPNSQLQQDWNTWIRRNRFGGEYSLGGHYWESFNIKYKTILQAHPEYLALVNGARVPWSESAKLCISNPDLRKLFIDDRTSEAKRLVTLQKYPNLKTVLSVEPSDGGGDCQCQYCTSSGTVSDRYFQLGNDVASAFRQISPLAYDNMYAYNTHAAPPKSPIDPNLLVQIIPYAFQNVGTPEQMIQQWTAKSSNLSIYDYQGLPDWHYDTPLTGRWAPGSFASRLKYWNSVNLKGFNLESSYSTGCTGLTLYYASRLGWNIQEDLTKVQESFFQNLFGGAASEVKKYYAKINGDFTPADLPYVINTLNNAYNTPGINTQIKNRILLLQAYVHYLVLYYEYQTAPAALKNTAWENLTSYIWKIYPTGMVHTTRIAQLIFRAIPSDDPLSASWNLYSPGDKLKAVTFATSQDFYTLLQQDRTKYPMLEGFPYVKQPTPYRFVTTPPSQPDPVNPDGLMVLNFPTTYIQAAADGYFRFLLKVNPTSTANGPQTDQITCIDPSTGTTVYSQAVTIDTNWKEITIPLSKNKIHQLIVTNHGWIRIFIPNTQWAYFGSIPTYSVLGKMWMYVPENTKYLYYSNSAAAQPRFFDEYGNEVVPEKANNQNLLRLPVRISQVGKWWTVIRTEYKTISLYSPANQLFPHPNFDAVNNTRTSAPVFNYFKTPPISPDVTDPAGMMILNFPETYVQAGSDGYFHFLLKVNIGSTNNTQQTNEVSCIDPSNGATVFSKTVYINANWQEIKIPLTPGKTYRLVVVNQNWIRVYYPTSQWVGMKSIPTYSVLGKLWFYVPAGLKAIYYSNSGTTEQPLFYNELGASITPVALNEPNLYAVPVQPSPFGRWMSIDRTQYKRLTFYQFPDLFFSQQNIATLNPEKTPTLLNYVNTPPATPDVANPEGMMLLGFPETYVRASSDGFFRFLLKVNIGSVNNTQQTDTVQCIDPISSQVVYNQIVNIDANWKEIAIPLTRGKTYKLNVIHSNWIRIHIPTTQWAGFKNIPTYSVMGTLGFYMPAGQNYIYYSNSGAATQPVFKDSKGNICPIEKVNDQGLFRVLNTGSQSSGWMTIDQSQYKFLKFYDLPDLFVSHPNFIVQ